MVKKVKRPPQKSKSSISLENHIDYLGDTKHDDHLDKILHPGINVGCIDDSKEAFVDQVIQQNNQYLNARAGLGGKRADRIWDEIVYNCGPGVFLTPKERKLIEEILLNEWGENTVARLTWHEVKPVDAQGKPHPKAGQWDLHVLLATKTKSQKVLFGAGCENLIKRIKRSDKLIVEIINSNPERITRVKTAEQVGIEESIRVAAERNNPKPEPLPMQIAKSAGPGTAVTRENLLRFLENLKVKDIIIGKNQVSLLFPRKKRKAKFSLSELLLQIREAQYDLEHAISQETPQIEELTPRKTTKIRKPAINPLEGPQIS